METGSDPFFATSIPQQTAQDYRAITLAALSYTHLSSVKGAHWITSSWHRAREKWQRSTKCNDSVIQPL